MKRGTPDHPKMETLALLLGIPEAYAVGIMAKLWEWASKYTPAGDVGKYSDEVVAKKAGWQDDPNRLITALLTARWLDYNEDHRLVVHDWAEHCEDSVHAQLARQGLYFASGERPKLKKLSQDEKRLAEEKYASGNSRQPTAANGSQRQPTAARPSIPSHSGTSTSASANAERAPSGADQTHITTTEDDPQVIIHQAVRELLPNHPRPSPSGWAESAIEHEVKTKHLNAGEFCSQLKKTHVEHCAYWERERARDPNAFVPIFHLWIRDGYYLNRNCSKDPPKGKLVMGKGARLRQELADLRSSEGNG